MSTTMAAVTPTATLRLMSAENTLLAVMQGKKFGRQNNWVKAPYRQGDEDARVWSLRVKVTGNNADPNAAKKDERLVLKIHFCVDSAVIEQYGSEPDKSNAAEIS